MRDRGGKAQQLCPQGPPSWLLALQLEVYAHLVQVRGGGEVAQRDLLLLAPVEELQQLQAPGEVPGESSASHHHHHPSSCPAGAPARLPSSSPRSTAPGHAQVFPTTVGSRVCSLRLLAEQGTAQPCQGFHKHLSHLPPSPLLAVHGQHHAGALQLHLHPPGHELQRGPAQQGRGLRGLLRTCGGTHESHGQ